MPSPMVYQSIIIKVLFLKVLYLNYNGHTHRDVAVVSRLSFDINKIF